jgi:cystathionine beta-lyase
MSSANGFSIQNQQSEIKQVAMFYNFDECPKRRDSDCIKWRHYAEDVLPMWVADMDFASPEPVIRALHERVEHGIFGYPAGVDGRADQLSDLRQLIMERLERLYGWQVEPEALIFLPGVVTGFNLACHALAAPGGNVLIQPPVYFPFLTAAGHAGMARQDALLQRNPDGSYGIDWEGFEAAITPETRLFILCNPHNPVGRVFTREELGRMAEICLRKGVILCSDEIHCDLIYTGHRHTPLASLDPEIARRTITLMAPSKTFNLPGLQCAFAIIPDPELRKQYRLSTKGLVGWVNLMGLTAAEAAYAGGQEWLDQLLAYLEANRDFLFEFVKAELPALSMAKPEGTYLAWLDCREAGIEGNPFKFFLEKARVALADGAMFGSGGEGFVRLNFGCPRATLQESLERMKEALN